MDYKQNLIFKKAKSELVMNSQSDFRVIDIKGLEASSYTINTAESQTDGANETSTKVQIRDITIEGDIDKNENETKNRAELIRFFNPKEKGEMYITRNGVSMKIAYKVSNLSFKTNKMADYIQFTLDIECIEEPYFSDAKNSGNKLTLITPQFTFPLAISPTKIMGYKKFKDNMVLYNNGDKETGVVITVTAQRGNANTVKIILNNNEYIKVNTEMSQGDVLVINTNPRHKSITLNGVNIINKIDRYSTFFSIKQGKNVIKYEATEGGTNLDINVEFYRKYLGI